jgi:hypothetical protein
MKYIPYFDDVTCHPIDDAIVVLAADMQPETRVRDLAAHVGKLTYKTAQMRDLGLQGIGRRGVSLAQEIIIGLQAGQRAPRK